MLLPPIRPSVPTTTTPPPSPSLQLAIPPNITDFSPEYISPLLFQAQTGQARSRCGTYKRKTSSAQLWGQFWKQPKQVGTPGYLQMGCQNNIRRESVVGGGGRGGQDCWKGPFMLQEFSPAGGPSNEIFSACRHIAPLHVPFILFKPVRHLVIYYRHQAKTNLVMTCWQTSAASLNSFFPHSWKTFSHILTYNVNYFAGMGCAASQQDPPTENSQPEEEEEVMNLLPFHPRFIHYGMIKCIELLKKFSCSPTILWAAFFLFVGSVTFILNPNDFACFWGVWTFWFIF